MKPERRCEKRVNALLLSSIHYQAMGGTATSGTPDTYYEAPCGSMWIEWKWTNSLRPNLIPEPSELQKLWLRRANGNGINVAVICGAPLRYYVFPGLSWESRKTVDAVPDLKTKQEVANWIGRCVLPVKEWPY